MNPASPIAATVLEALPYLVGMWMVMIVLAMLWGLCALVALGVRWLQPEGPATAGLLKTTAARTGAAPRPPDVLDPERVAVIAAAVACSVGRSHRVVSIKPAGSEWEKAGRQAVLSSHRIR